MPISLAGISMDVPSRVYAGQLVDAYANIIPVNATVSTILWQSDNTSIGTISPNNQLTAVLTINPNINLNLQNSFNLKVTIGNYSQNVEITVIPTISTISFSLPPQITTSIGYTFLTAPVIRWNDHPNTRSATITYSSSDPASVSVDSSGIITAVANTLKLNSPPAIITGYTNSLTRHYASTLVTLQARPNTLATSITGGYVYVKNIYVGKTSQAYLAVQPYNVQLNSIVWSSSDQTVATIDESTGKILGLSRGSCYIRATIGNDTNSLIIQSKKLFCVAIIDSLMLTPPAILGMQIGDEYTNTLSSVLSIFPGAASSSRPIWTSLDPAIVTVDANYTTNTLTITALGNGATTISVQSTDSNAVSATMYISVQNTPTTITTNNIPTGMLVSDTFQGIINTTLSANNKPGYYSAIQWTSSNPAVATVSSDPIVVRTVGGQTTYSSGGGLITAISPGTTDITVKVTSQLFTLTSQTVTITVTTGVDTIVVSPGTANIPVGTTLTTNISIVPTSADNKTVVWSSSNPSVATVDQSGVITGVASGNAVISAMSQDGSNVSGKVYVNVGTPITTAEITMSTTSVYIGKPIQASVTLNPDNPDSATTDFTYWNPVTSAITTYTVNTSLQVNDTGLVIGGVPSELNTIRASVGNQYSDTLISVTSDPITILSPIVAILASPKFTLPNGTSSPIIVTIAPANASNKVLSWISFDSSVAEVDSVSGTVTANSVGTTYVRATATDGSRVSVTIAVIVS